MGRLGVFVRRIAVECDSASSLIVKVESGGIAVMTTISKRVAGKRLLYRPPHRHDGRAAIHRHRPRHHW